MRRADSWVAVAVVISGCLGGTEPEPSEPIAPADVSVIDPDESWVWRVAADPASFAARIDPAKPGWVALHANRLPDAIGAFDADPVGRARAEWVLGVLYTDLANVAGRAADGLYTAWEARGTLPQGDDIPMVAALAAYCADGESSGRWAGRVVQGQDQAVAQAMVQGRSPFDVHTSGPFGKRMRIHHQVRTEGDPQPLLSAAGQPVSSVPEADFERNFWDPCVYRTLSDVWLGRAIADATGVSSGGKVIAVEPMTGSRWRRLDGLTAEPADLGSVLFAPWPTASDLSADLAIAAAPGLVGAHAPSLRQIGVGTATFPSDDPEAAREEVRLLDAGLDALQRRISDLGDAEGVAVINDLGLVHRFRQEWLIVRARKRLADDHPRSALVMLELARDHADRTIGPRNAPSLFALTALARIELGHTREALDALHVLAQVHPEIRGIVEVTGELAVLQGLDRTGVSKEE